jgi:hypothetical protein
MSTNSCEEVDDSIFRVDIVKATTRLYAVTFRKVVMLIFLWFTLYIEQAAAVSREQ